MGLRLLVMSLGVFCAATSVVMTKASELQPELLSAGRLLVAGLVLFPLYLRDKKRLCEFSLKESFKISTLPAILLGLHFITWTIGARLTTSANTTLIVNLTPVVMPFLGYYLLREKLNHKEWIGTVLALLGVVVLGIADFRISPELMTGDTVSFVSMLLMAWYFILARMNKSVPSIWLYLVPLYTIAGILCAAVGIARNGLPDAIPGIEWLWILLLGLIPTVLGHSLLNLAMQWFRSQFFAITNQLQFVYAGLLGYFFFAEIPHGSFYLASSFMMAGVVWTIFFHCSKRPSSLE